MTTDGFLKIYGSDLAATYSVGQTIHLLDLPEMILETILVYTSYEKIAQLRRVDWKFNTTCKFLLNKGFRSAEKYHLKCLKEVKSMLPRRESERRTHKLSRHCDILTAIETRISLLSMTFVKYVDLDLCCFIPGKVIDEIFSVLRTIQSDENPPRAYEILQELRDISSMAMEHFDENIVPSMKVQLPVSPFKCGAGSSSYISPIPGIVSGGSGFSLSVKYIQESLDNCSGSIPSTPLSSFMTNQPRSEPTNRAVGSRLLLRDVARVSKSNKKLSKRTNRLFAELKRHADTYKGAVDTQNKKIVELGQRVEHQDEQIAQQNTRLAEQEEKLAEMNRRLLENEQVVSDLTQKKDIRPISSPKVRKRESEDDERRQEGSKRLKSSDKE